MIGPGTAVDFQLHAPSVANALVDHQLHVPCDAWSLEIMFLISSLVDREKLQHGKEITSEKTKRYENCSVYVNE